MSLVDPLPAGAMTFTGKTNGPALNLGRARPHQIGGRQMYVHVDELRDWVVKAGWHTEPQYQQLLGEFSDLQDALADADVKLAEYEEKIEALEAALGWKPKENTANGDGENRERDVPEGRIAPLAGSAAGAKDSSGKAGGGKGRKVRAKGAKTS